MEENYQETNDTIKNNRRDNRAANEIDSLKNRIIPVENLDDTRMELFRLSEVELLRYNEPKLGYFIAETDKVILRALEAGYEPVAFLMEERYVDEYVTWTQENKLSESMRVIQLSGEAPIYVAAKEVMSQITGYALNHGMLCVCKRKEKESLQEFCQGKQRIAVLEDVVNPTNVGAIMRSAAAMHMDGVILTNASSDPLYRRAARVSMGTVFQIPWIKLSKREENEKKISWLGQLKEEGFATVALALKENSLEIDDLRLKEEEKLAVLLGTEGEGLKDETIAACDYTVIIPMSHQVDSLNVAAASAVAFWELGKKR